MDFECNCIEKWFLIVIFLDQEVYWLIMQEKKINLILLCSACEQMMINIYCIFTYGMLHIPYIVKQKKLNQNEFICIPIHP